tara:strand:- start:852 stop:1637 length:786 start_codon:yes stop_codon:yes gene_type:complete
MKKLLLLLIIPFLSFGQDLTYVPDDNFEQALIDAGLDDILDNYVLTSNISNIQNVSISGGLDPSIWFQEEQWPSWDAVQNDAIVVGEITDLTGIEGFSALTVLSIYNTNLSSLDVSSNINLMYLYCNNNQLTSIDISQNINLTDLICGGNPLVSLNVQNGNNQYLTCDYIVPLACGTLASILTLNCIQVDDVNWANLNWGSSIDTTFQYFSDNCDEVLIAEHKTTNSLLHKIDILGRETTNKGFQLHIYDDGSVEKKYLIK